MLVGDEVNAPAAAPDVEGSSMVGRPWTIVFRSPGGMPENAGAAVSVPLVILVLTRDDAAPPCGMVCNAEAAA